MLPNGKLIIAGGADSGGNPFASAALPIRPPGPTAARSRSSLHQGVARGGAGRRRFWRWLSRGRGLCDPARDLDGDRQRGAARYAHTAALPPNGGCSSLEVMTVSISRAPTRDPATGTDRPTGGPAPHASARRRCCRGKVLVAGGYNGVYLRAPELPIQRRTRAPPAAPAPRYAPTATLLPNGKVLVAAGG